MPKFLKLNPGYVELLKTLFEPGGAPADLGPALDRWERGEVQLTDAQVRLLHSAVVERGIPRARELAAGPARSGPLSAEIEERLQAWDTLARILGASLPA
jgi:hypothetical protein